MMSNPLKRDLSWLALSVVLTALCCLNSAEAAPEGPWYQFEVIIFERISAGAGGTEIWPNNPGTPSAPNAVSLLNRRALSQEQARQAEAYRLLPSSEWQLAEHAARLRRSRNYRPLLHLAWRQPMTEPERATPVFVDFTSKQGEKITGILKIGLRRYLHLEADLLLQPRPGGKAYRMQASRRMRSEELHYLDHPIIGVLAIAKRFTVPSAAESVPAESPAAMQPAEEASPANEARPSGADTKPTP